MSRLEDQTIALAGMFQAARLVQDIAWKGRAADPAALESSLRSLFTLDAESTAAVYGSVPDGISLGLRVLQEQLSAAPREPRKIEITTYVLNLLMLERKLTSKPDHLHEITTGIETSERQREHFGSVTHPSVIGGLADLYQKTISTLGPKILVQGDSTYLRDSAYAEQIRALLLAGIRSAVLWAQKGGSRWRLIWNRKDYIDMASRMARGL
jgi:high frequency lysogenization protein